MQASKTQQIWFEVSHTQELLPVRESQIRLGLEMLAQRASSPAIDALALDDTPLATSAMRVILRDRPSGGTTVAPVSRLWFVALAGAAVIAAVAVLV